MRIFLYIALAIGAKSAASSVITQEDKIKIIELTSQKENPADCGALQHSIINRLSGTETVPLCEFVWMSSDDADMTWRFMGARAKETVPTEAVEMTGEKFAQNIAEIARKVKALLPKKTKAAARLLANLQAHPVKIPDEICLVGSGSEKTTPDSILRTLGSTSLTDSTSTRRKSGHDRKTKSAINYLLGFVRLLNILEECPTGEGYEVLEPLSLEDYEKFFPSVVQVSNLVDEKQVENDGKTQTDIDGGDTADERAKDQTPTVIETNSQQVLAGGDLTTHDDEKHNVVGDSPIQQKTTKDRKMSEAPRKVLSAVRLGQSAKPNIAAASLDERGILTELKTVYDDQIGNPQIPGGGLRDTLIPDGSDETGDEISKVQPTAEKHEVGKYFKPEVQSVGIDDGKLHFRSETPSGPPVTMDAISPVSMTSIPYRQLKVVGNLNFLFEKLQTLGESTVEAATRIALLSALADLSSRTGTNKKSVDSGHKDCEAMIKIVMDEIEQFPGNEVLETKRAGGQGGGETLSAK